jgi:hypothetical protein
MKKNANRMHEHFVLQQPSRMTLLCLLAGLLTLRAEAVLAVADFNGIWMPVQELADEWDPALLPLTEAGAEQLAAYDPRQQDSALFCMPLGTPRNTLTTAAYPMEILQRPEQVTMIFDGRGDVRRIFLDGRDHPADPVANWMGHSVGGWNGESLTTDTTAMTADSRLTAAGLPHSEAMRLTETWRLVERGDEALLRISLVIEDPVIYTAPLTATRYYRRAPHASFGETAANCQLDQWRSYLERHSKELSMQLRGSTNASGEINQ